MAAALSDKETRGDLLETATKLAPWAIGGAALFFLMDGPSRLAGATGDFLVSAAEAAGRTTKTLAKDVADEVVDAVDDIFGSDTGFYLGDWGSGEDKEAAEQLLRIRYSDATVDGWLADADSLLTPPLVNNNLGNKVPSVGRGYIAALGTVIGALRGGRKMALTHHTIIHLLDNQSQGAGDDLVHIYGPATTLPVQGGGLFNRGAEWSAYGSLLLLAASELSFLNPCLVAGLGEAPVQFPESNKAMVKNVALNWGSEVLGTLSVVHLETIVVPMLISGFYVQNLTTMTGGTDGGVLARLRGSRLKGDERRKVLHSALLHRLWLPWLIQASTNPAFQPLVASSGIAGSAKVGDVPALQRLIQPKGDPVWEAQLFSTSLTADQQAAVLLALKSLVAPLSAEEASFRADHMPVSVGIDSGVALFNFVHFVWLQGPLAGANAAHLNAWGATQVVNMHPDQLWEWYQAHPEWRSYFTTAGFVDPNKGHTSPGGGVGTAGLHVPPVSGGAATHGGAHNLTATL